MGTQSVSAQAALCAESVCPSRCRGLLLAAIMKTQQNIGCGKQSLGASTSVCLTMIPNFTRLSEDEITGLPRGSEIAYHVSKRSQPAPLRNVCDGCSGSSACKKGTQLRALCSCQVA